MVVVIQVSGGSFIFVSAESLYPRTVGKENIGPAVVIVVENDGAVSGGFNNEFLVRVAAVDVERGQSRLRSNVIFVLVGCFAGCATCAAHQLAGRESTASRRADRPPLTSLSQITLTS